MRQINISFVTALLVTALASAACSTASTSTTASSPTAAPATTTTAAPTTTVPGTTTTAAPTTTVPGTTTTAAPTSTVPETTTTAAAELVELSDEGVQAGATWVHFGFDDAAAIAAVTSVLGAPTNDSGWIDSFSGYGTCPGTEVRGVHWGDFVMLFTTAQTDFWTEGVPHFFAYVYAGSTPSLLTTEGIGIGSTLEMLESAYGGSTFVIDEAFFDPSLGFWSYDLNSWTGLSGSATGQDPTDTVTHIQGGRGCGE